MKKLHIFPIIIGLIGGFFLFPFPDFSKSLLVGVIDVPKNFTFSQAFYHFSIIVKRNFYLLS